MSRKEEFVGIQYLRGIAALLVVVYHLHPQLQRLGYDGLWLGGLSSGVDIFFVISGLIMSLTTNGRDITPVEFYTRRFVRIVPLYWITTAFTVLVLLMAPAAAQSSRFDLAHVVASFAFIPYQHPVLDAMAPVVIPGWTLNYEAFFYLIFGMTLLLPRSRRGFALCFALLGIVLMGQAIFPRDGGILDFYSSAILLEFCGGVWLGGVISRSRVPPWPGLCWLMFGAGLGALVLLGSAFHLDSNTRAFALGVPALLVVYSLAMLEKAGALPTVLGLRRLGDSSYSLYLSHGIVLSAVGQAWRLTGMKEGAALLGFSVVAVVSAVIVGFAVHIGVEKPASDLVRTFIKVRPASARTA